MVSGWWQYLHPVYTYVGQALSEVEIPSKSQIVSPQK